MTRTEGQVLADVLEKVRELSNKFIAPFKDLDLNKPLSIDGTKFNTAYWIVAHLVWAEHFIIIKGVAGENMNIDWLDDFCFGSNPDEIKNRPAYEIILAKLDEVHAKSIDIIRNLNDEELDAENHIGAAFGASKSKRNLIMHAIRHEPMHIGQLSWILKTNGISYA